jgi:hypothetical protein
MQLVMAMSAMLAGCAASVDGPGTPAPGDGTEIVARQCGITECFADVQCGRTGDVFSAASSNSLGQAIASAIHACQGQCSGGQCRTIDSLCIPDPDADCRP